MNPCRPTLAEGLLVAAGLSFAAYLFSWLFAFITYPILGSNLVFAALGYSYLCYLLCLRRFPVGAAATMVFSLFIILAAALSLGVFSFLSLLGIGLWLLRIFLFRRNTQCSVGEALIIAMGLAAGCYVFSSNGSLGLACWSFFLIQASFSLLPGTIEVAVHPTRAKRGKASFDSAYKEAISVLERQGCR